MIKEKMKSLIMDINLLVYIHDVIYLRDSNSRFNTTSTYKELHESSLMTIYKYLRLTRITLISFIITLIILRNIVFSSLTVMYGVFIFISIVFGILFVFAIEEFKSVIYQLKAKKAVQYALANFSYDEFKYFLDSYLSEQSTKNYQKVYKFKK